MTMTPAMQEVMEAISLLQPEAQDELAAFIRAEMLDEQIWEQLFADPRSEKVLADLAAEALAEYRRGETLPLDPESIR